jgi:hypothetical protein
MFKSIIRAVCFLSLATLLISCGSNPGKQASIQAPPLQKKYTLAYISNVSVTLIDDDPDDRRLRDKQNFESRIPSLLKEKLQSEGFTVLSENPGAREGLLAINVKVKYDPGNRALRSVAGMFGAGKGTIEAYVEGIDQTTGTVVASTTETNTKRLGGIGGNFYDMAEDTVEDATDDLTQDLSKLER